jgi:protein subunit release factor A
MHDPEEPFPIPDDDEALLAQCRVETFRAGGPGGQHQNVTESGVRLLHLPTGIRVTAREERSQHRNRARALLRLRARLEERNRRREPRIPTKPTRASRKRRLDEKRRRGETKRLRKPPKTED